jgi:hypothetical protein
MDPHKNIFYYYRGQTSKKDNTNDKQLENNLTKALINVLDPGNLDLVTENGSDLASELFSEMIGEDTGKLRQVKMQEGVGKRTLDVVLSFENTTVGVESKFGAKISLLQLNEELEGIANRDNPKVVIIAHSDQIDENRELWKNPNFKPFSWQQIYDFFENKVKVRDIQNPEQIFLLKQYLEYMRLMHMTGKFTKEDFDAVANTDMVDKGIKDLFGNFAKEVQVQLPRIQKFNISKEPSKHLWITFTKKAKKAKEANNEPHFTSHLNRDGIDMMFNAESRSCPKNIARILIGDNSRPTPKFEEFWKKVKSLENSGKSSVCKIIFMKVKKLRQGEQNEEPIFKTEMELKNKSETNPKYRQQHEDTEKRRKEYLIEILRHIRDMENDSSHYVWFRISCLVKKDELLGKDSLKEQAKVFIEHVEPITGFYDFFM